MEVAKAWIAALMAVLGTVTTALEDGRVETSEIAVVVAAALVAYGAVWKVPNRPA